MVVLLMGVSGSGKTTIGTRLASALGCPFVDGDAFHTPAAVAKMARGEPLDDADRAPWLARIRGLLDDLVAAGRDAVVACSALTPAHRDRLGLPRPDVRVVLLHAPEAVLRGRLQARQGHFVHDELLSSQLALLDPPSYATAVDVRDPPDVVVAAIRAALGR